MSSKLLFNISKSDVSIINSIHNACMINDLITLKNIISSLKSYGLNKMEIKYYLDYPALNGHTPLWRVCKLKYIEIACELIDNDVDINKACQKLINIQIH